MPQAGIDPRSGNSCPGCGWSEGGGGGVQWDGMGKNEQFKLNM